MNMLNDNDSSCSFDTIPWYDGDGNMILFVSDDEGEEGYSLPDDDAASNAAVQSNSSATGESAGILILPPVHHHSNNNNNNNSMASSSHQTVLSIPDSVPSDLQSLRHTLPNPILVTHHSLYNGAESDGEQDLFSMGDGSAAKQSPRMMMTMERPCPPPPTPQFRRVVGFLALLGAAISVVVTVGAISERRHLKAQVRDLQAHLQKGTTDAASAWEQEEKTRMLQDEVNRLQKEAGTASARKDKEAKLEEEVRRLQKEAEAASARKEKEYKSDSHSKSGFAFPWEKEDPSTLIDNCWVHAQAKMELGDCSREASKTVKKQFQSLTKSVWNAHDRMWSQMRDDYREMKEWLREYPQSDDPSSKSTKTNNQQQQRAQSKPPTSQTKNKKQITKPNEKKYAHLNSATKSILTTAALGTAAAVLLSAVDWFGTNDD